MFDPECLMDVQIYFHQYLLIYFHVLIRTPPANQAVTELTANLLQMVFSHRNTVIWWNGCRDDKKGNTPGTRVGPGYR